MSAAGRMAFSAHLALAAAVLALGGAPAAAADQLFQDPASGLTMSLPDEFEAVAVEPMSGDVQINVNFRGLPACRVVYAARPGPRKDAALLRATVDTIGWRSDLARRAGGAPAEPAERLEVGDALGGAVELRAQRMVIYVLETPAGRTTLFCLDGSDAPGRVVWDVLARGLRPPP